jgi:hypothetical protein
MLTMVSSVVFFYWKEQWQSGDESSSSSSSSSLCNGGFYCLLFFSSLVFLAKLGCSCSCFCSLLLTPIQDHQLPEAASARVFTSVLQQFSVVVVVVVVEEFFAVSSPCRGNAAISFQEKSFSPRLSRLDTRFPTFFEANSGNVRKRRKKERKPSGRDESAGLSDPSSLKVVHYLCIIALLLLLMMMMNLNSSSLY